MTRWSVTTTATTWRTEDIEADTLDEALNIAVIRSEEWGDNLPGSLRFGSWATGDAEPWPDEEEE